MRKLITKKETTDILISHGAVIGQLPGVTYTSERELDQNMLTLKHSLDAPDFYIEYDFTKNRRSGVIWGSDMLVVGAHNFAAFLVDTYPHEFGAWRERFDCPKRILATRDKDDLWTKESYELADDVVTAARTGMKLLPITRQMTV